jgi:hypothetical protein
MDMPGRARRGMNPFLPLQKAKLNFRLVVTSQDKQLNKSRPIHGEKGKKRERGNQ